MGSLCSRYSKLTEISELREELLDEIAQLRVYTNDHVSKVLKGKVRDDIQLVYERLNEMDRKSEINRSRSQLNYRNIQTHEALTQARLEEFAGEIATLKKSR